MKYSAKSPYPSLEQWSMMGFAPLLLMTTLCFVLVNVVSVLEWEVQWMISAQSLLLSLMGTVLMFYAKLPSLREGRWKSFGVASVLHARAPLYRVGRMLVWIGCVGSLGMLLILFGGFA